MSVSIPDLSCKDPATEERIAGIVKWFNDAKGYGFIEPKDLGDVLVHYSAITMEGYKTLPENQQVTFILVRTEKGLQARDVRVIGKEE